MSEEERSEVTRVSFEMPRDLHNKLTDTIPWGVRSHFFRKIIEIALSRIEKGGYEVVGAILAGDYDPLERR